VQSNKREINLSDLTSDDRLTATAAVVVGLATTTAVVVLTAAIVLTGELKEMVAYIRTLMNHDRAKRSILTEIQYPNLDPTHQCK
jgi:hypothetical protein